jgi:hypothetical protein
VQLDSTILARFWAKADKSDGCWQWIAFRDSRGYGRIFFHGESHYAHRVSYALAFGAIPAGLQIDHLCRNRACINPAHLEAVTARENVLRGEGMGAKNARRTHCKRGHALPSGARRVCQPCRRERKKAWQARNAARAT